MPPDPDCFEDTKSRRFHQEAMSVSLTTLWNVRYTSDLLEVRDLLSATAPPFLLGLSRKSIDAAPNGAPDLWTGTVEYIASARPDGLRPDQISFKITGTQSHINQSLQTLYRVSKTDVTASGLYMRVDGTDDTVVVPDDYVPVPDDVNKVVSITGGTGWTVTDYTIESVTTSGITGKRTAAWKLSASPAAVTTGGGHWTKTGNSDAAGTNLVVDNTNDALVDPDGYTPTVADVGNAVVILDDSPNGWTAGVYTIAAVTGGKWLLSESPGAIGLLGGLWHLTGTAADYEGAIGVTLDEVKGCDILVPHSEFTYSCQRLFFDFPFYRTMRSLVGKLNDAPFFGFPAGTLLYLGCEPGSATGHLDSGAEFNLWNLAHSFLHEPDATAIKIGGITVPKKGGHEYLWARYDPVISAGKLLQNPTAVYVEKVYKSGDFGQLEIPGSVA